MTTYVKDPAAVLDYAFDWTPWLETGETITAHTVTVATGITLDSTSVTGGKIVAWLDGGTVGKSYAVTCQVTTSKGRTDERTLNVVVRER